MLRTIWKQWVLRLTTIEGVHYTIGLNRCGRCMLTPTRRLRFKGRFAMGANAWVGENDAEVTVEVQAIPPMNENGPDQWKAIQSYGRCQCHNGRRRRTVYVSLTILDDSNYSNTRLEASIFLTRCGPDGLGMETAFDRTAGSTSFEMIYDKTPPDLIGIEILVRWFQPANNHVWPPDQDLPLRLYVEDAEGLETPRYSYMV